MSHTTPASTPAPASDAPAILRFEVRPRGADPRADAVMRAAKAAGLSPGSVRTAKIYFIEAALDPEQALRIQDRLLADPVTELAHRGAAEAKGAVIEVHPLPGVMDPAAQSVRGAIFDLTGVVAEVSTGTRFDVEGITQEQAQHLAQSALANPVVHQIKLGPWTPRELPKGQPRAFELRHVRIRGLSDAELQTMSREAHLFLSLDEMRAVREEFERLGREPTDIELETIAQTWSEHCVHKTLKSTVRYNATGDETIEWAGRPGVEVGDDGTVTIRNLLKSTVAAATFELIDEGVDWALSVFKDNSGVIAFDETWGVNIKVETHNRPSAIEPYGGAATGAGGCIRDVIATGLGSRPIANTDVFCVAHPTRDAASLPPGTLHPRRILTDVVAGVRDYGNRMGIPTISGAVYFDDRYVGNPLVYCGCVGLIPRRLIKGQARPGDRIVAIGGRTGRDGIHGATFSSAQLESSAATEFAHAVQIGNAIEEKRLLEAILRARDMLEEPLFHAITDCGAGGFSSAVGEMGSTLGAAVDLDRAPLKYAGLSYTEVWISEAQERMVLAVPPEKMGALRRICEEEHAELADLGAFGTPGAELILNYAGTEVGRLPMHFLHEGIPMPTREASWSAPAPARDSELSQAERPAVAQSLHALLAHPNIASKHWIVRQYDHEVQGNTVIKPLVGPGGRGPGDASVIQPVIGSTKGIAIGCGLQTSLGDPAKGGDAYQMALAGVDEAIRNVVCVGGNPNHTAILDNFCWPSCDKPENMASLVRASVGCYDAAKAYRTPFVSGKDSLNNQLRFTDPATGEPRVIEIPPTLLITSMAVVPNVARCVTMDAKKPGNVLLLVGRTTGELGGSHYAELLGDVPGMHRAMPAVDLRIGPAAARAVAQAIRDELVVSAHDCSDGGLLVAVAEMLIATTTNPPESAVPAKVEEPAHVNDLAALLAGHKVAAKASGPATGVRPLGAELNIDDDTLDLDVLAFAETPSRYVLEVKPENVGRVRDVLRDYGGVFATPVGRVTDTGVLAWPQADLRESVEDLARVWRAPLDW